MVMLSDPVILLQEIEPKKPTHPIKNVGNIERVRVDCCGGKKVNIKELGKYRSYLVL